MEAGELDPVCDVCEAITPKYTCPGCSKRTCSLTCVKEHKISSGCSGKRVRTEFIKLAQMDDESITLDDCLLREMESKANRAAQIEPKQDYKSKGREGAFRWMLAERRLLVKCLPSDFSRHRVNRSRVSGKGSERKVKWTIELRRLDGSRSLVHDVDESMPITSALPTSLAAISVLDEGAKAGQKIKLLDITKSLQEQLVDLTIIEYPILIEVTNRKIQMTN